MQHVRRPRAEYEALLAPEECEGQRYTEPAAESGGPLSSRIRWLPRIHREQEQVCPSGFVELEAAPDAGRGIEVRLANGHRLVVHERFDAALLRRVVAALGC